MRDKRYEDYFELQTELGVARALFYGEYSAAQGSETKRRLLRLEGAIL